MRRLAAVPAAAVTVLALAAPASAARHGPLAASCGSGRQFRYSINQDGWRAETWWLYPGGCAQWSSVQCKSAAGTFRWGNGGHTATRKSGVRCPSGYPLPRVARINWPGGYATVYRWP